MSAYHWTYIFTSSRLNHSHIVSHIVMVVALRHFTNQYSEFKDGDGIVALDAKLISLAVAQMSEALDGLAKQKINTNNAMISDLSKETALIDFSKKYQLDTPLEIKRLEKKDPDLDPRVIEAAISYGGVFAPVGSNEGTNDSDPNHRELWLRKDPTVHAQVLSCFIRAQASTESSTKQTMESFLQSLLWVIQMCYEFQFPSDVASKKKKRKATESSSSATLNQRTLTRCVLAADALNFLRACLTRRDYTSTTMEAELLCMSSLFRENEVFTVELMKQFVDLGYDLQDKVCAND